MFNSESIEESSGVHVRSRKRESFACENYQEEDWRLQESISISRNGFFGSLGKEKSLMPESPKRRGGDHLLEKKRGLISLKE